MSDKKIKIMKDGPYLVSGSIPLTELYIEETGNGNIYTKGKVYPLDDEYALCRCGKSKNMPFCDRSHRTGFNGTLTASKQPFANQTKKYSGQNIILKDNETLCALARFCHIRNDNVWDLTANAHNQKEENLAIKMACDCPSGRLVMHDKKNEQAMEPVYEPGISILQDPFKNSSGPLWIRGGIPIEAEDGYIYEIRNRVTLCRCGHSNNKPFCDAKHIEIMFNDNLNRKCP